MKVFKEIIPELFGLSSSTTICLIDDKSLQMGMTLLFADEEMKIIFGFERSNPCLSSPGNLIYLINFKSRLNSRSE